MIRCTIIIKEIAAGQPQYVVQAGAFEEKENAVRMAEAFKKAGIDACVKPSVIFDHR